MTCCDTDIKIIYIDYSFENITLKRLFFKRRRKITKNNCNQVKNLHKRNFNLQNTS